MPISDLLDEYDRAWLDWRWGWLIERIGVDRVRRGEVYDSIDAFSRSNNPVTKVQLQELAEKIAEMLGITMFPVYLVTGSTETSEERDAFYAEVEVARQATETMVIDLPIWHLADPQFAAYIIVRQIISEYLVMSGWLDPDEPDFWEVVDLASVQLGVGVILANNVVIDQRVTFGLLEWGRSGPGTALEMQAVAYALARLANTRLELSPSWGSWLKGDPRKAFKKFLKEFESVPPHDIKYKPEGMTGPLERKDTLAREMHPEEYGWREEELVPANTEDLERTAPTVYCCGCAYILTHLPPGDCPECGRAFDPEDLRTVTLMKPNIMSESSRIFVKNSTRVLKRVLVWGLIIFVVWLVVAVVMIIAS